MYQTQDAYYRISVKALIQDNEGRFLFTYNIDNVRDLIGGGLDHGETPQEGLIREVREESGLTVTKVEDMPYYFDTCQTKSGIRRSNVYYKAQVSSFDILPTAECLEVKFFGKDDIADTPMYDNLKRTMIFLTQQ